MDCGEVLAGKRWWWWWPSSIICSTYITFWYLLDFRWLGVNGILYLCGSGILKESILTFPLLFDLCPLYPLHSYFPHHWVRLPMNNDDWLLRWTNGTWISIILHPGNQEIIFPAIFYPTLKCIFIEKQYWMYWKNTVPILKTWLRGWIVAAKFLHFQISIIDTLKS